MNSLGFGPPIDWGGGSPSTMPDTSKIDINKGGVIVKGNITTLDKILGTITSIWALERGAGYVPTTHQPAQQPIIYNPQPLNGGGYGSTGGNIEGFIRNNTGLLLIAGIGVVLFMSGRK